MQDSASLKAFLGGVAIGASVLAIVAKLRRDDPVSLGRAGGDSAKIKAQIARDWAAVKKTDGGRVDRSAFIEFMLAKHASLLTDGSKPAYTKFLNTCFGAGTALMLPASKSDLGRHCFSYSNLMAGEFYFAAAQNASDSNCGCNTPVADVLALTK